MNDLINTSLMGGGVADSAVLSPDPLLSALGVGGDGEIPVIKTEAECQ